MTSTKFGMLVGAVLALVWIVIGFWAFVVVLVAIVVGAIVGRVIDGRIDLRTLAGAFQGKRSSS